MSVANRGGKLARAVPMVLLSLLTFGAAVLVVTGAVPETTSPAVLQRTLFAANGAVICLRDGCGCDKRPHTWVDAAAKRHQPVLILLDSAKVTTAEEQAFRQALPPTARVSVVRTNSLQLLARYAPSGKSTLTLTRFGFATAQSAESGAETMLASEVAAR